MLDVLAAGMQPSVLDFIDGDTLEIVAGGYPGVVPARAGFALLAEVDGSRAEVEAQRRELVELLGGGAVTIEEPTDSAALWRWRDGFNGVVTAVRGGKVSEDVAFPVERLAEGLERFSRDRSPPRAALVRVGARRRRQRARDGAGGRRAGRPSSTRREAAGEELFALTVSLGGSIAGEHGVGWLKRGLLESQWDARAVELHEQVKRIFDPKGLLNPGKKLARDPARADRIAAR